MSSYQRSQSLHGPWPTLPEELAAQYTGRWTIYRELDPDGTHGRWVADSCLPSRPERITAQDIESLADKLAAVES